jgi:hypothetical protein
VKPNAHTTGARLGAHYTPRPVVRFMVHATVGRWLWQGPVPSAAERADPDRMRRRRWRSLARVARLRVLDPACGPGIFLLEAFDCLLDWHLERARWRGRYLDAGACAARLARESLYGVDVDLRVAEVARMALARRIVEASGGEGEARGPDLAGNVVCGNTLVAPAMLPASLGPADRRLVNPWDPRGPGGFPAVLGAGGFDVVLGNPPYVFGELLGAIEKAAYRDGYELGRSGQPDLFKLFFERTVRDLLRAGGVHAFIVPDALLARDEHADLRRWLVRHGSLARLCHVGPVFVSQAAPPRPVGVSAVVVVTEKSAAEARACSIDRWGPEGAVHSHDVALADLIGTPGEPWSISAPGTWHGPRGLRARLEAGGALGTVLLEGTTGLTRGEELGKSSLAAAAVPGRLPRDHVAIYAGADVHRHAVTPPRRHVARARVVKDPAFYRGPKILFVKTGAGPVAAVAADDLPALQSVYVLHARPSLDPDGIVAVVCSALVTAYVYYAWTSGKRLQPQLTIDNVRAVPFPARAEGLPAGLARLGALVRAARRGRRAGRERAIDDEVARLFGLSLDEWLPALAPALGALPASQRPRWWERA